MSSAGIDVIVPCYNYGRYLRQCTQSVLRETRFPVRVLIIDDASPDGSAEVAREIAAEDGRVEVIAHSSNQGHIATYNEGIAWVEAPYMLLLSADDLVTPGALARAIDMMERRPEVAVVHGEAIKFSDDTAPPDIPAYGACEEVVVASGDFIRRRCLRATCPFEAATAIVRTEVQKRVGGYRPELPHAGDLEMWLRCASQGAVGYISGPQALVRIHATNMRSGYEGANNVADVLQRMQAFRFFFRDYGDAVEDAAELEKQVCTRLAAEFFYARLRALLQGRPHRRASDHSLGLDPVLRRSPAYRQQLLEVGLRTVLRERGWEWLQQMSTASKRLLRVASARVN